MSPEELYDQIESSIKVKDYDSAKKAAGALLDFLINNPWDNNRRPVLDISKFADITKIVDPPAGSLWLLVKGINQKIRELPPEDLKPV